MTSLRALAGTLLWVSAARLAWAGETPPMAADAWMSKHGVVSAVTGAEPDAWQLAAEWPGAATVWRPVPRGRLPERLSVTAQAGAGTPGDLRVSVCLKDKDGVWFQTPARPLRPAGDGMTFSLSAHDPDVSAVGHGGVWNAYFHARTVQLGLCFFSTRPGRGEVTFRVHDAGPGNDPPESAPTNPEIPPVPAHLRGVSGFAAGEAEYEPPHRWLATAWQPFEIAFDVIPPCADPGDPNEFAVDVEFLAPSGRTIIRPAFFDQPHHRWIDARGSERIAPSGRAGWKVRFTPTEEGAHRWRLVARRRGEITFTGDWRDLPVAADRPTGFVRVSEAAPDRFEDAAGAPFWPLGLNLHSPVDARYARLRGRPPPPDRGTFLYEEYFVRMGAAAMNTAIVWMSNWWLSIEWNADWPGYGGLGDCHWGHAWKLDRLFADAARNGIHLLLVLDNHGKLSDGIDAEWPASPYNAANGGPCRTPEEFWTHPAAWRAYAGRLRYIVARWGAHPNLLGYELVSEINWTGSGPGMSRLPEHVQWIERAQRALRELDPHDRPVTVQYSGTTRDLDERVAASPALSFLAVNAYRSGGELPGVLREVWRRAGRFGKPVIIAEFGGAWNGSTSARLAADLRAGLWTALASDAAAAPFFWWHEFVAENNLYADFAAVARVRRSEHFTGGPLTPAEVVIVEPGAAAPSLRAVAGTSPDGARLWLYDATALDLMPEDAAAIRRAGATVRLAGLAPGRWRVAWFDTASGSLLSTAVAEATEAGAVFDAPPFAVDVFALCRREEFF